MKAIGGYFELELRQGEHYHKNAIKLNTARNCLEYVLKVKNIKKIYIPYYTCEVILEPIKRYNIKYKFYHININLEPEGEIDLKDNEVFLYTNYFGLKQNAVEKLVKIYSKQLIVDNSQAFYAKPVENIDTFYSARKFFGVPDGAYLYTNKLSDENFEQDVSFERMTHLLKRIDLGAENAYDDFKANDKSLENQSIKKMSNITESILKSIDYESIKQRRIMNYKFLEKHLGDSNMIKLNLEKYAVPMAYPYLTQNRELKCKLQNNKIFVPRYWDNVLEWVKAGDLECLFTKNLLPIPIDQRYEEKDMSDIKSFIQEPNVIKIQQEAFML